MGRKRRVASKNNRNSTNFVNLVLTCCFLAVAVNISDGNFTQRISNISKKLDSSLRAVFELEQTNYTEWKDTAVYESRASFNARGMGGLYNITNLFMKLVLPQETYPEEYIVITEDGIEFDVSDWSSIAAYYVGLIVVVSILLLFAILMPFCGLCFCCCRCCGNCGARSKPVDKKHDLCKKIFLATFLICLGTLMLFGVVCAFVSNQQMQDGTEELTGNLKTSVKDTGTYLNSTSDQINTLFVVNYNEFENTTFRILNSTSSIIFDQLLSYSNAVSMTEVTNIVNGLPAIQNDLEQLKSSTNAIRVNASQLNDALRKVKRDLLQTLNKCNAFQECSNLQDKYVSQLSSDIDFDSLPDVGNEIGELQNILSTNLVDAINQGHDNLLNIQKEIQETVEVQLTEVKSTISTAGSQIKSQSKNVTQVLDNVRSNVTEYSNTHLNKLDDLLRTYSPYRYYVGLGASCVLLFVTFFIALGLTCGICGKRPDAYGDDCCSKGVGSKCLMWAIFLMFFSAFFLAVITIGYFTIGIVSQRLVCDTLRDPANNQVMELIDELVNIKQIAGVDVNVTTVLTNCHKNQSIYNVFNLSSIFNVNELNDYISKYNINGSLDGLIDQIDAQMNNIEILNPDAEQELEKLAQTGLSDINFDRFQEILDNNFTKPDLLDLVQELTRVVGILDQKEGLDEVISDLKLSILHLESYQSRLVDPMVNAAKEMKTIAENLDTELKFNKSSFSEAITSLIEEVKSTELYLRQNGSDDLKDIAKNYASNIETHVQTFLDRVRIQTLDNLGKCGPLSRVINATLVSTCDKILLPWNGFWFGVFWSLVLFIPTIIVSVKLATLYQKYNPYTGHLMENDYLYDAYTDRENIPLNSNHRGKPSKKKQKKRRREDRGIPVPLSDQEVARDYPAGSQDARYADMAPKHWEDFPANGPPQYQRAPTEYERPPPYYYPGTGEQQR